MVEVCSMPSHGMETLRCESYTTPRSDASDSSSDKTICNESEEETDYSSAQSASNNRRHRARSAPSHFSVHINESLTERLLDNSEQCSLEDSLVFESSVFDDWSEAASGWRVVVPYPKYVAPQPSSRNKSESATKKPSLSIRAAVRCIDEDFRGDQFCPSWKGNVEPMTYRYVPNNGYYRNNKPMRDVREWPVMKKSKTERSRLTPEMRQAQKTLKRDLDNHFKAGVEENTRSIPSASTVQDEFVYYQESPMKPQQTVVEQKERVSERYRLCRRLPAREQQLIKSASDLFMEKFNTRLNALEKEIQIPGATNGTKKSAESTSAPNHSPTQITKKLKEVRVPDTARPTIQSTRQHDSNFGDDLFTVKPMCKPEVPLRPLEKLTPKQKQMEKSSTSSRDRSPSPEMQSPEDEDLMIMLACATSQPPPLPKDPESCGISTARSAIAMTNFDIEKMRNIPLRSEYGGKPKPFVVQKDNNGSTALRRGTTMRYTMASTSNNGQTSEQPLSVDNMERREFVPHMERPVENKFDSVGSTLPEIMGKRLSVITTSQRLL